MIELTKGIQCQFKGTVSTGVITQGSQCKPDIGSSVEYIFQEVGLSAVQQNLTGLADTAAQNHSFGYRPCGLVSL